MRDSRRIRVYAFRWKAKFTHGGKREDASPHYSASNRSEAKGPCGGAALRPCLPKTVNPQKAYYLLHDRVEVSVGRSKQNAVARNGRRRKNCSHGKHLLNSAH